MAADEPSSLGLGPRAEHVVKLARDLLVEAYGPCGGCGGPRGVVVVRSGAFDVGETRTVLRCEDCGRRALLPKDVENHRNSG